jgi:hypothetical protein
VPIPGVGVNPTPVYGIDGLISCAPEAPELPVIMLIENGLLIDSVHRLRITGDVMTSLDIERSLNRMGRDVCGLLSSCSSHILK